MQFEYAPQQLIKFLFTSDQLVHIRITVNDQVRIIQCRTEMLFATPMVLQSENTITIENLTTDAGCRITKINLNYLDLLPVAHQIFKTYEKQSMAKFGEFVPDIYCPDIAVMQFDSRYIYSKLLPLFKTGQLNWSGVEESNLY